MSGWEAPDDLVGAARQGHAHALHAIWTRYSPLVLGYLRVNGVRDPEDLTSEVFLAVFERIHRFRGDDDDLRAFIFTVAHHRIVDDRRRAARTPAMASYDAVHDSRVSESAETAALRAINDREVQQLLAELPVDQRDVILLRFVADLSLEEVAAALGKRVGAVKSLQHRALARLKKSLPAPVSLESR